MNAIANTFRGFLNVTASGVLLLVAVTALDIAINLPYGNPSLNDGGTIAIGACVALACLTAFLALKFWRHSPSAGSSTASSFLNGVACLLLVGSLVYYFFHR
ncbi:hypothetical protein [Rhodanobacter terrae]|uniref:Uncharacterized protein n=1 Tax=Rhodanobacter terrae TaxID=418647 RepID=A0ABW0T4A8_9GAMM